ncbi:MAG: adenylate/guanylate cyclase domain-containing protein [Proteobacteria bacterium]|nr:adenylate/guanylate cyclase domain-containing protein [Pseudomonadota bacterium]MDA1354672.1 adenylate/guanylate cyclase domain-containing protein [Pseudomonadota bacterium]
MTDHVISTVARGATAAGAAPTRHRDAAAKRLSAAFHTEVMRGLLFSTRARAIALGAIAVLVALQNWEAGAAATLYFEVILAVFFLLGVGHYKLAKSRFAHPLHKYLFTTADVLLLGVVILLPAPFDDRFESAALHLRGPNFLYFLIIMAGTILTYSPRLVIWNGIVTILAWSAGVWAIISLPETITFMDSPATRPAEETRRIFLDENFVFVMGWVQQIVIFAIFTGIMALVVWRARRLVETQASTERERANLSRYFSPNMVDELAASDTPLGAVRRQNVAVLFADIVGFTGMSETRSPEQVIALLRGFHGRMEEVVFAHGGTLDKYIGDAVMATFGTPHTGSRDATDALTCAIAMADAMATWNLERMAEGEAQVRVGIGLQFGPAVLGDTGGAHRLEFAVIGDTVNVASRLEHLTRTLDGTIVAGGVLVAEVRREGGSEALLEGFRERTGQEIPGRSGAITVWAK